MRFDVVTIFPELFEPFVRTSLLGKAIERGLVEVGVHDLRDWTSDRHRTVDDVPYGGGGGMVMRAAPWLSAVRALRRADTRSILLTPQGERLDDALVRRLAAETHLLLLCGRYEGIDERVRELVVDQEISIGDFVLSGGEIAAMAVVEAVSRQVPGVVGLPESVVADSFRSGLLDYPHYTRPVEVEGLRVPEVLLSGNHAEIARWRHARAVEATARKRPDLLARRPAAGGSEEDASCAPPPKRK